MTAQQGEKQERENHFKTALEKYRFAGSLIDELRKSHPDWQPAIVEYRGRKISEGILRIQDKLATQNELATAPQNPGQPDEGVNVVTSDAAIKEATKKLRSKVDQLQSALDKSRSDLETARKGKGACGRQAEGNQFQAGESAKRNREIEEVRPRSPRSARARPRFAEKAPGIARQRCEGAGTITQRSRTSQRCSNRCGRSACDGGKATRRGQHQIRQRKQANHCA